MDNLQVWLTEIGLGNYYEEAVKQGYDTLELFAGLDDNDITAFTSAMKMPPGHALKFKQALKTVKTWKPKEAPVVQAPAPVVAPTPTVVAPKIDYHLIQAYRHVHKPTTAENFYAYLMCVAPQPYRSPAYEPDGTSSTPFLSVHPDDVGAVPIYASYNEGFGYCYLTKPTAAEDKVWMNVGIVMYLLEKQVPGSVPIYRQAHTAPAYRELLLVTNTETGGWTNKGIIGYGFPKGYTSANAAMYEPNYKKQQVNRFVFNNQFYAYFISTQERPPKTSYAPDGNSFKTFMGVTADTPDAVAIYASHKDGSGYCYKAGSAGTSNGWVDAGIQFYLLKRPVAGSIPIFKQYHKTPVWRELALTTNKQSGDWTNAEILGYGFKN